LIFIGDFCKALTCFLKKTVQLFGNNFLKDPNSPGQVKCKICQSFGQKSFFKYSGNTSNLWDHVKRKYPIVLEAEKLVNELEQLDDIPNVSINVQPSTGKNIYLFKYLNYHLFFWAYFDRLVTIIDMMLLRLNSYL